MSGTAAASQDGTGVAQPAARPQNVTQTVCRLGMSPPGFHPARERVSPHTVVAVLLPIKGTSDSKWTQRR